MLALRRELPVFFFFFQFLFSGFSRGNVEWHLTLSLCVNILFCPPIPTFPSPCPPPASSDHWLWDSSFLRLISSLLCRISMEKGSCLESMCYREVDVASHAYQLEALSEITKDTGCLPLEEHTNVVVLVSD